MSCCWCQNLLLSFKAIDRSQFAVSSCVHDETKQLAQCFAYFNSGLQAESQCAFVTSGYAASVG